MCYEAFTILRIGLDFTYIVKNRKYSGAMELAVECVNNVFNLLITHGNVERNRTV